MDEVREAYELHMASGLRYLAYVKYGGVFAWVTLIRPAYLRAWCRADYLNR